jgi:hypothetical protein
MRMARAWCVVGQSCGAASKTPSCKQAFGNGKSERQFGVLAQLVERLNGSECRANNPISRLTESQLLTQR